MASVAVEYKLVRSPFYEWCATSGATAAAQGITPQQTTGGWPRVAAPHASHQSPLQHPPGSQSPLTWNGHFRPSSPGTSSPSGPSPLDPILQPRWALLFNDLPFREAGSCSLTATASFTAMLNCRTSYTITRCWLPVCKRPNSEWTPLSSSSQAMPQAMIAWPEAAVEDSVTLVYHSIPHRVTDNDILPDMSMTRRKFWQSRLTSGEPHWPSLTYTYPLRPPALRTTPQTLTPLWRTLESRWCLVTSTPTIPPGSPEQEMTGQQPEGELSKGDQQFATHCCEPRSPYHIPLPRPALLAGYHPSEWASPPWCDLSTHHWVWPSQYPARPRLHCGKRVLLRTSARLIGRDLQQRQRGNSPIYLYQPPALLGKVFRHILGNARRHHIHCGYVRDYCYSLPQGPVEVPAGILRPCYQSQVLLVPPAQAGWQEIESPTKYLNRIRWKNPFQPEGNCTSHQQAVNCLFCQHNRALRRLPHTGRSMREASQRPLGRRALPPPRSLMGSLCSTSAD